jgi:acyl-CoA thioesterase
MTPQSRADRSAMLMYSGDAACQDLGIVVTAVGPGRAILTLDVRDTMLNGHSICHGGYIFTLADSAFAYACNSYNQLTVAQQNQITFVAPAQQGDTLTATALEVSRTGRSGTYDVTVTNAEHQTIALMRGLSRTIKGQHFDEDTAQEDPL